MIRDGAKPRIESNDVWKHRHVGIMVAGAGTDPVVRGNRIHSGDQEGIWIAGGANPSILDNEIWGNALAGLSIETVGTSPSIVGNKVRDGHGDGVAVKAGASPTIRQNTITGNAGLPIRNEDGNPTVGLNTIFE
jgi:parallel beta-helix repeat protein